MAKKSLQDVNDVLLETSLDRKSVKKQIAISGIILPQHQIITRYSNKFLYELALLFEVPGERFKEDMIIFGGFVLYSYIVSCGDTPKVGLF
jgi:hypothetical protein